MCMCTVRIAALGKKSEEIEHVFAVCVWINDFKGNAHLKQNSNMYWSPPAKRGEERKAGNYGEVQET